MVNEETEFNTKTKRQRYRNIENRKMKNGYLKSEILKPILNVETVRYMFEIHFSALSQTEIIRNPVVEIVFKRPK